MSSSFYDDIDIDADMAPAAGNQQVGGQDAWADKVFSKLEAAEAESDRYHQRKKQVVRVLQQVEARVSRLAILAEVHVETKSGVEIYLGKSDRGEWRLWYRDPKTDWVALTESRSSNQARGIRLVPKLIDKLAQLQSEKRKTVEGALVKAGFLDIEKASKPTVSKQADREASASGTAAGRPAQSTSLAQQIAAKNMPTSNPAVKKNPRP